MEQPDFSCSVHLSVHLILLRVDGSGKDGNTYDAGYMGSLLRGRAWKSPEE